MESDEDQVFITCEVCDLPFTGIEPFEQHMKGKKHKKQVKDTKRQSKLKSLDGEEELEEEIDSDSENYICNVCEKKFTGNIPYKQHLKSTSHAKALRRKKADDSAQMEDMNSDDSEQSDSGADLSEIVKEAVAEPYRSCFICDKKFSGPEIYLQHMKSKSHGKYKRELQLFKKMKSILTKERSYRRDERCEDKRKMLAANEGKEELECKDCDSVFSGAVSFVQHLASKAHAKRQRQNEILKELKALEALEIECSSSSEDESDEILTCQICDKAFSGAENLKLHIKSKKHKKAVSWKKYLTKKGKLVEKGSQTNISLPSKDITGVGFTNSDHADGTPLSAPEERSAPPESANDEEYLHCNESEEQMSNNDLDRNENTTTDEDDDCPKSSCLPMPSVAHDTEMKTVPVASCTISVEESSAASRNSARLKESETDQTSSCETGAAQSKTSKPAKGRSRAGKAVSVKGTNA